MSTKRVVEQLIERDGQKCHYCGRDVVPNGLRYRDDGWSVDHVIPQTDGGSDDLENLVLACRRCNQRKKHTHYQEFRFRLESDAAILFLMGASNV